MELLNTLKLQHIITISLVLFSVIDIIGSVPIIIDLRKKSGSIQSLKATVVAGGIMIFFLYFGAGILSLIGIDVYSFAVAGSVVLFLLGLEMVLGQTIFKNDHVPVDALSIVPIAFPLIAGAGTMTTIVTLRAEYKNHIEILIGIVLNLVLVYGVLKTSALIERMLGPNLIEILRKIFGIVLIAIAVKIFKTNLAVWQ